MTGHLSAGDAFIPRATSLLASPAGVFEELMYRPLHRPLVPAVITRLVHTLVDGVEIDSEVVVGTILVGIEDITGNLKRSPGGLNVQTALRLYTGSLLEVLESDLVALKYRSRNLKLVVDSIVGPFGSGRNDHQEITAVSRLGSAVGFQSGTV